MEPSFCPFGHVPGGLSLLPRHRLAQSNARDGFSRLGTVFPDLAYSRPGDFECARLPILWDGGNLARPPIRLQGSPKPNLRAYESYLERLVQVAVWLIQTQRTLVFFLVAASRPPRRRRGCRSNLYHVTSQHSQIRVPPVSTVDGFLEQAAAVDVVVATRLHSLLFSQLAGTPTIAISPERKVDVLMKAIKPVGFALDIDAFSLHDFAGCLRLLKSNGKRPATSSWPQPNTASCCKARTYNWCFASKSERGYNAISRSFSLAVKEARLPVFSGSGNGPC